jgi:archaellum biogenesis protein FlaJ (TadC family)
VAVVLVVVFEVYVTLPPVLLFVALLVTLLASAARVAASRTQRKEMNNELIVTLRFARK